MSDKEELHFIIQLFWSEIVMYLCRKYELLSGKSHKFRVLKLEFIPKGEHLIGLQIKNFIPIE